MGKETDRLVSLADDLNYQGASGARERDVLLSVGRAGDHRSSFDDASETGIQI